MAGSAARQSGVSVATSASSLSAGPPSGKGASAVAAIRKARASGSYAGDAATSDDADEFLAILTGSNITYLAPERLNFAPSSKACDMWSYGCLVYFMCSGKLPWLQMKTMKEVRKRGGVVLGAVAVRCKLPLTCPLSVFCCDHHHHIRSLRSCLVATTPWLCPC